jgi:hypothetical protein
MNKVILDTSFIQYAPWRAFLVSVTPNPQVSSSAFRPPQWGSEKPKTFIEDPDGTIWYFDAVPRVGHDRAQKTTNHPVQDGAAITDHSYTLPAQLTLEVGMSEVMDSYIPRQWDSGDENFGKSQTAYQIMLGWLKNGIPLSISTRLDAYENMVLINMSTPDDILTKHGLKCTATFQQIFVASIEAQVTDLRPATLDTSQQGTKSGQAVKEEGSVAHNVVKAVKGE